MTVRGDNPLTPDNVAAPKASLEGSASSTVRRSRIVIVLLAVGIGAMIGVAVGLTSGKHPEVQVITAVAVSVASLVVGAASLVLAASSNSQQP